MRARLPSLLRQTPPPLTVGMLVGAACVVVETFLLYPLRQVTPVRSLGVVYLLGVLVISIVWGLWPGLTTAVASCLAYNYFHLPPSHSWTHLGSGEWVRIAVFLTTALLAGFVADLARSRAIEADEDRRTADLAAELAHLLLRAENPRSALPTAAHRLAQALKLPYAEIQLRVIADDDHRAAFPLRKDAAQIATLLVPGDLPEPTLRRLRKQVVPALEALLSAACDREAASNALQASRDELRRIADEQAALRRVATLVAAGASPPEVFNAVAGEMGHILGMRYTLMIRYESDGTMTVVGDRTDPQGFESYYLPGAAHLASGSRLPLEEGTVSELVWRTGKPARINSYEGPGERVTRARELRFGPSFGCPIVVEGHLWGVVVAFSQADETQPEDTEGRMVHFAELVATALANAESRAELTASRARVVAAADETRRRIERDLHDGTQQRLVALGLELRAAEATAPSELKAPLSHTVHGLTSAIQDLQEISRGLHPAILSQGGLRPALSMLARRSAVPVELSGCADRRLAEHVEVAVYYIVSEALTNVAKHAHASLVNIDFTMQHTTLELSIRDDGIGGADPGHGSGLIGLKDRVAVLGGNIVIDSPAGKGTSLLITIPTGDA